MSKIPLVDLAWQHRLIAAEVTAGMERVIESGAFILGPDVAAFEEEFAAASGVAHSVAVASGTDALELIFRALDIGVGDEVILPANTFIASALAVARAGATPVLVDSDPETHLIDPAAALASIGSATRAVLPVNLYGQIAPFEKLQGGFEAKGISIVEDAAQSQGARRNGRPSGSFGIAAGVSFYPAKNLGAYGDAGAIVTDDEAIAARIRKLRNYGSEEKYHHPEVGFNSRLDTLQAVVLRAKLRHLDRWNEMRREAALRYEALLSDVPDVRLPVALAGNEHVWHVYPVRVPDRDRVLAAMNEQQIGAGVHYPLPIHLQGAFEGLGYRRGDFPAAESAAEEMLSIPLFPGITEEQQERVARVLIDALARSAS